MKANEAYSVDYCPAYIPVVSCLGAVASFVVSRTVCFAYNSRQGMAVGTDSEKMSVGRTGT